MARDVQPSAGPQATGWVWDELFLKHTLSPGHPESPLRLSAIAAQMERSGLAAKVTPIAERVEPAEHILALHSQAHCASVSACPITGAVAAEAVARVLGAVRAVQQGRLRNAFCAVRPPGHHAHNNGADYDGRGEGQGFCFYDNVAIAARFAQRALGCRRVLICDWDYHYGNGTAWFFRADPSVFVFSTHNFYTYPGTGDPSYRGEGAGLGCTLNVHLDSGATDTDIAAAWDRRLLPGLEAAAFVPDIVLLSAGFDSRVDDTLGSFVITDAGYAELTRKAMAIAQRYCGGRLVSVLEGGYNVDGLAAAVCAHVATLAGLDWRTYVR